MLELSLRGGYRLCSGPFRVDPQHRRASGHPRAGQQARAQEHERRVSATLSLDRPNPSPSLTARRHFIASTFQPHVYVHPCSDGEDRQLSVFLKDVAARAERHGYVEIPPAPIMPSPEVLDSLTTLEQPPEPPKPPTPPPVERREEEGRRSHRGGRRYRGRRRYHHDDDRDRYTAALVPPPPQDDEEQEGEEQRGGEEGADVEEEEGEVERPPAIHPTVPEPEPEAENVAAPSVGFDALGVSPGVTQEFVDYCESWLEAIVDGTVPGRRWPS